MASKKEKTPKAGKTVSGRIRTDVAITNAGPSVPIVGIGASAGGLEALEGFFAHLPPDLDTSFVIIQHLDPHRESLLGKILANYTKLAISEIKDGMQPEKGAIYVNPPNFHVSLFSGTFCLFTASKDQEKGLPIDLFFRSLADDLNEKAIGIILSGTGTDGTLGIKAVKERGGMTMVQTEAQAAYSGMPLSAIQTGLVDVVLPVEKMGEELKHYLQHPYVSTGPGMLSNDAYQIHVKKILFLIRSRTGNDFSGYKLSTVSRRIERRMALHQFERIEEYFRYAQQTPGEVDTLFKDLLIGVTNFFRDPEAFEALAEKTLFDLLKKKEQGDVLRVWVPGCATGEEAYSLAILICEAMETLHVHPSVQIFASDIDEDAIHFARQGIFPDNIAVDVSRERLKRFFERDNQTFIIRKQIRDMIVFAPHNLIKNPPFSKLNLVSCRNLLIYMEPELQKKILPLFHFTLNPEGILFLGSSESIGGFADLFTPIDTKWKIFKRREVLLNHAVEYPPVPLTYQREPQAPLDGIKRLPHLNSRMIAEKVILEHYAPPGVLIDEKFNILYFIGKTSPYLCQPAGEPSMNLLKRIDPKLLFKLNLILNKVVSEQKKIVTENLQFQHNGNLETVTITVTPVADQSLSLRLLMVVFESTGIIDLPGPSKEGSEAETNGELESRKLNSLEQELNYTRETLQNTIEELETSNEELKSTNEELQSTNEELQSTNEELETSKEEMHSTNEELVTVNSELQNKVRELEDVNNDINNLLAATQIATLFLDADLRIKRFTPASTRLFNLIESDIGRPIHDITSRIDYDNFQKDAREVLEMLVPIEREFDTSDGRVMTTHILPYRTTDNRIDGIVATFVDMTARNTALRYAKEAQMAAESMVDALPDAIVMLDADMNVVAVNRAFLNCFQLDVFEIRGKSFFKLSEGFWNNTRLKQRMRKVATKGEPFKRFKFSGNMPACGPKSFFVSGVRTGAGAERERIRVMLTVFEESDS